MVLKYLHNYLEYHKPKIDLAIYQIISYTLKLQEYYHMRRNLGAGLSPPSPPTFWQSYT